MSPQAVVVGGGHNGLIAAAGLAHRGIDVTLLEIRDALGGACRTERFACGCYVNSGATVFGLFAEPLRMRLTQNLRTSFFDRKILDFDPELVVLTKAGWLPWFSDPDRTSRAVSGMTRDSRESVLDCAKVITAAAGVAESVWMDPRGDRRQLHRDLAQAIGRGVANIFVSGSLLDLAGHFFRDDATRTAFLATNILAPMRIDDRGSALPLLYLSRARASRASWGLVAGGYERFVDLLKAAAVLQGVDIRLGVSVRELVLKENRIVCVRTSEGTVPADVVVSTIDPVMTTRLVPEALAMDRAAFEAKWLDGGLAKVNMLLKEPLQLDAIRGPDSYPIGQLVVGSGETQLIESYVAWARGNLARDPYLEVFPLYEIDRSASCGEHYPVCGLFLFVPYRRDERGNEEIRKRLLVQLKVTLSRLDSSRRIVPHWIEILTPRDIERRFLMYRGNPDHGSMVAANLLDSRPLPSFGWKGAVTPIANLVLGGAGANPGGLVSGLPGEFAVDAAARCLELP